MKKRVETFIEETSGSFQRNINNFLESQVQELHDIKFSIITDERQDWYYALMIYTPFDEEQEDLDGLECLSKKIIAKFANGNLMKV
jgi:hypothetical protein